MREFFRRLRARMESFLYFIGMLTPYPESPSRTPLNQDEVELIQQQLEAEESRCDVPPFLPQTVLRRWWDDLSKFERVEILSYPKVYTIGDHSVKLDAHVDALKRCTFVDHLGHYISIPFDHIAYRYTIMSKAGIGSYGTVLRCIDEKYNSKVAIKIISLETNNTYEETEILMYLRSKDARNTSNCIRIMGCGHFRNFHYLVFKEYATDLHQFIRKELRFMEINYSEIALIAQPILEALLFLKKHNILHGDLKTANILLDHDDIFRPKLADFSISCFVDAIPQRQLFQSLYYRAPELFCGKKADISVDMWSFACVVAELALGFTFMVGDNNIDQFYLIEQVLGVPTRRFFKHVYCKHYFFTKYRYPAHCKRVYDRNTKKVSWMINPDHPYVSECRLAPGTTSLKTIFWREEQKSLRDFLSKCLTWTNHTRISPEKALNHSFFNRINKNSVIYNKKDNLEGQPYVLHF